MRVKCLVRVLSKEDTKKNPGFRRVELTLTSRSVVHDDTSNLLLTGKGTL